MWSFGRQGHADAGVRKQAVPNYNPGFVSCLTRLKVKNGLEVLFERGLFPKEHSRGLGARKWVAATK